MLRILRRDPNTSQQSLTSWIFLAHYETRCTTVGEEICEMSKHATFIHQPVKPLNAMLSPCLFSQFRMDIVGPFPLTTGQRKFLLVAIDYFTKWVEAGPLARITEGKEVYMEEHHMSLQTAPINNIRQWPIIPMTNDTRLVRRATLKAEVHLGISSLGPWSSRGH
ncbi:UNVERIFIED_CONTAM: hypothetical protein Sangu_2340600 [Sesamum angustifolium]|uniref:Gypsy retrotransposon integrase-like protein 1 n=1 Tax=Sesamum angustifolium TaxID=2727405 RepID=A0AAW2L934_9LAMI